MRYAGLIFLLSVLVGCAMEQPPVGQPPAPGTVKNMALRLRSDNLQNLTPQQIEAVTAKIAENLKSWGYPVRVAGETPQEASHILEAWISKPELKSLPPGFSISFGSEDQRAPDRQKTEVVKVGCALLQANGGAGNVSLSGDFGVADAGKALFSGMPDLGQEHFYVDRMGSVCLNLLSELKIPKEKPKETSLAPAWIPDMQIEVKTKEGKSKPGISAPPKPASGSTEITPTPTAIESTPAVSQPAPTAKESAAPVAKNPVPTTQETAKPPEPPKITTEERLDESDQRKQLIIHNQGSPIILEFGYDENRGMKW